MPIFKQYQVPVLYNFRDTDMKWIPYTPKARMHVLDRIFPEGIHIPDYFFGKNIVHLPTTKCHIYTTTTGAMKNAFGGLLNTQAPLHALVDSPDAGRPARDPEGNPLRACSRSWTARRPATGRARGRCIPVVKNVMLASADQVAIDAVSAKMMGFDPMSLEYIRLAHEDGLGVGDPRDIEIVGDTDAAAENWHFHVGKNLVRVGGGDLIWFGPLKRFQKLFFHTPLVNGFILASDVYHDFYRWPLVDRRVFERWCETTAWGQMFLRYAQMGPQAQPLEAPAARTPTVPISSRIH